MTVRKPKCVISTLSFPRYRFHVVASSLSLPCCRFLVIASTLSLPRCRFHVVASTLSLPRCRFHVVASTESLFYRGVTFKFLTKILVAALLFYNVCFPSYHFHVVASRCGFHVVATGTYRDFNLETVLNMADMFYNSNFFMSLVVRPLCHSWISLQHHGKKAESPEARQHGFTILYLMENKR